MRLMSYWRTTAYPPKEQAVEQRGLKQEQKGETGGPSLDEETGAVDTGEGGEDT